ncbi:MAG: nucleotidyltransferase domain-containing protein [Sporomusaceae bacterium]|jgi:predicted nucleotidyltransferase|nr:nucleotidyltransferase domain-containing protein [Sporomusaceae bacterium]
MVDLKNYLAELIDLLKQNFEKRLLYVGLQGSYLRGEADENSDIDVMVILDSLTIPDLELYQKIIKTTPGAKTCGFICGKAELCCWNPCEICQLLYTTKDHYGSLKDFVPPYTREDERNYIKISLNNLYHALCHGFIHATSAENKETLPQHYKSVFFILQNIYFFQTGDFVPTQQELLVKLIGDDRQVLQKALVIKKQKDVDFTADFAILFNWCKNKIPEVAEMR